jgi:hypothetical protein
MVLNRLALLATAPTTDSNNSSSSSSGGNIALSGRWRNSAKKHLQYAINSTHSAVLYKLCGAGQDLDVTC